MTEIQPFQNTQENMGDIFNVKSDNLEHSISILSDLFEIDTGKQTIEHAWIYTSMRVELKILKV